jgi:hypothetical protein
MDSAASKPKRSCPHRVFARIEWLRKNGQRLIFEQTEFGIMVREKRKRQEPKVIPFSQLHSLAFPEKQKAMI